jgi:bifunctional DNase/RNase
MERVQMDIIGLSTSPAAGGSYALILKELTGHRRLPIVIGAFEAQAIAFELEGITPPRPLTHDLMKSIIETLMVTVTEIVVTELRDGTFHARVMLETMSDTIEVDSRPSDAIALAVRFRAPIYVAEEVLEEAGFVPEEEATDEEANQPDQPVEEWVDQGESGDLLSILNEQLKDAIQREDYEEAARIRDRIRSLE